MADLKLKETTLLGYVVAFKKSNRKNAKEYFFLTYKGNVVISDYITDADRFKTREEAQKFIDKLGDDRLYITEYKLEEYELV